MKVGKRRKRNYAVQDLERIYAKKKANKEKVSIFDLHQELNGGNRPSEEGSRDVRPGANDEESSK